ncbi:response regulator [Pseudomonas chlororaphis subsp. piscium]|uniref:response regulator n=1 Tax=Pseudomonas chlororaphis TaxID=587753 RepID=UPI000F576B0E|nr:response regulator [Pseudomonas chlororaphis]UQS88757.1 response regulator [Pseudomonas chlororaphis subsp. piscium]
MKSTPVRVMIADDHPVILFGLKCILEGVQNIELVSAVGNSTDLISALRTHACDVLIVDYYMPKGLYGDGMTLLAHLRKHRPSLQLIVFTMLSDRAELEAIRRLGVCGIINKKDPLQHLPSAILAAQLGEEYLSPEVTSLLGTGN